jgi:hypothetical protein
MLFSPPDGFASSTHMVTALELVETLPIQPR